MSYSSSTFVIEAGITLSNLKGQHCCAEDVLEFVKRQCLLSKPFLPLNNTWLRLSPCVSSFPQFFSNSYSVFCSLQSKSNCMLDLLSLQRLCTLGINC